MNRNLDGYYFRVEHDGKWQSICWSDLTEEERYEIADKFNNEALKRFCVGLGTVIRKIGDELDLVCE